MAGPFLIGDRVQLRAMEESDAEAYATWINDPELRAWLTPRFPKSNQAERDWIVSMSGTGQSTPRDVPFAIELREDRSLIGAVSLHAIDWVHRRAMTGIFLFPAMRGRGYGTEAKNLILDYAFGELGLHSLWAFVVAGNEASIHALERQGYTRSGVFRDSIFLRGAWVDAIYFDLLRPEWERMRAAKK